jgi:hypothetical protein
MAVFLLIIILFISGFAFYPEATNSLKRGVAGVTGVLLAITLVAVASATYESKRTPKPLLVKQQQVQEYIQLATPLAAALKTNATACLADRERGVSASRHCQQMDEIFAALRAAAEATGAYAKALMRLAPDLVQQLVEGVEVMDQADALR